MPKIAQILRQSPQLAWGALLLALVACAGEHAAPPAEIATGEKVSPPVIVGLERLDEYSSLLAGKRLGLVAHGASITHDGRHAIDVVRDGGHHLVRLFSPEHGLRGRAAAGEAVADGVDPASDLPVISLYGEQRQPTPADLADLDVLMFDLQGAGVRFYTYVSTLILCLEAAADADLELVVLDRPNPLGGERIEGPLAAARDRVPSSFVNMAPGPLVHGLTVGEMARYVNASRDRPARLTVIAMKGWQRSMTWDDTGRQWVPPSPNLRSAAAALAYPGTALLEATNVSEGRGTEAPFLLLGAPWVDPGVVPDSLHGFELRPETFIPTASAAAPAPKHLDQECSGWRVAVSDPQTAGPFALGLELLARLATHPDFEWRREGAALTWLLGTERVYRDLSAQVPVAEILARDAADHSTWRQLRLASLLY